jgi:hypothetical protein
MTDIKLETVVEKTIDETPDWKLSCYMDWKPKTHREVCPKCRGLGKTGGGFKDFTGEEVCEKCFGSGAILVGPSTPKPELPIHLREHMRRAWFDYFNPRTDTHD